jgi:hypothetical protein
VEADRDLVEVMTLQESHDTQGPVARCSAN